MKTIDVLLTETCLRQKEKTALREKVGNVWAETSYASLLQQARQVASGLQAHDFAAGGHAAILAPSSSRWVITYFGILLAGGIIVPVDKELKATELKHVLSDCAAQVIFTTHSYLDVLLEIKKDLPQLQRIILIDQRRQKSPQNRKVFATIGELVKEWHLIREEFHLPRERTAALEKLADEIYHLLLPEEGSTGKEKTGSDLFAPLNRLRQKLTQQIELLNFEDLQGAEPPRSPSRQTQAVAIILYTSGTTGRSKGAMLSHANIISNMRGACQLFQLNQDMHTLSFLPINHVFEQVCGILLPLSLGGTVSFAESLKKLGDNLTEVQPSFFLGVPAVFRVFYDRIMKTVQGQAFSRLLYRLPLTKPLVAAKIRKKLGENTTFISGGAALDPEIARGFRELGVKILQGYGITETSPVVSAEPPQAPKLGTVGPPLEDVQVRINHPNAEGVGEILIRGPNVMLGYYNNAEATAEVLIDGWYHSGDLGRLDADGYLSICGRVKNLIVTPNGKNVYPEEVELELLQSPYIAEVMVYGHQVSANAEEVHAIIFPNYEALDDYAKELDTAPWPDEEIKKLIRLEVQTAGKNLADYKRVKRFTLRQEEFPKTTTRKIKRFAVEAQISTAENPAAK